jgi:hypothetical protein
VKRTFYKPSSRNPSGASLALGPLVSLLLFSLFTSFKSSIFLRELQEASGGPSAAASSSIPTAAPTVAGGWADMGTQQPQQYEASESVAVVEEPSWKNQKGHSLLGSPRKPKKTVPASRLAALRESSQLAAQVPAAVIVPSALEQVRRFSQCIRCDTFTQRQYVELQIYTMAKVQKHRDLSHASQTEHRQDRTLPLSNSCNSLQVPEGQTRCANCRKCIPNGSMNMHSMRCEREFTRCSTCDVVVKRTSLSQQRTP